MLSKRIIACLDIKDGRTVKGVQFENIRDAGDPVSLAAHYAQQGIDELVFLDITATVERRKALPGLVKRIAAAINIPFTVGGGIGSVEDIALLLRNGADKVSINSAAFKQPALIKEASDAFGSQCVVVAIDAKKEDGEWYVYLDGGRERTGMPVLEWANHAVELGAGEILLTSMNNDGEKKGFALDITQQLATRLPVPVIASGGAGCKEDFFDVFETGKADAALAAGIFHFNELTIPGLKQYLKERQLPVRL
jgi:imidazole glycerol-phosphate synthase subunit HisF